MPSNLQNKARAREWVDWKAECHDEFLDLQDVQWYSNSQYISIEKSDGWWTAFVKCHDPLGPVPHIWGTYMPILTWPSDR